MDKQAPIGDQTMETVQLVGNTLAGLRWRNGKLPVLALHGWLDNAHSFLPMAPWLQGLDLVALDLPGHGHSAHRPPGGRYHIDDYVFDLLAVLDELGWDQAFLLGHSLGGAICTLTAAAAPERIRSLALIEGLGPLTHAPEETARAWRRAIARSRPRKRRRHADLASAVAARMQGSDLIEASAALLAQRGLQAADDGWQWRHDERLTWPSSHRYTEAQVLDLLAHIQAPTLCLRAEPDSGLMSPEKYRRRLAALPFGRDCPAGPGGHHLHMAHPQSLAQLIVEHFHATS